MEQKSGLLYLINHVFFPPKLPQQDDGSIEKDLLLIQEIQLALSIYEGHSRKNQTSRWSACTTMTNIMLEMKDACGQIIPERAKYALETMKEGDLRVFYISGQNSGLIVRGLRGLFCFELLELSPTNESVMNTKGRLQRTFPGPAIRIGCDVMADSSFCTDIAHLIAQLDMYTPDESLPVTFKAKSANTETRDTIHPKFATEMLTGILHGIGESYSTRRISKFTREDVLWDQSFQPWRRSPLYLLLRVVLQTSLSEPEDGNSAAYKEFMIFFMACILQKALDSELPDDLLFVMAAKIGRRFLKLGSPQDMPEHDFIRGVVAAAHHRLGSKWDSKQKVSDPLGYYQSWKLLEGPFSQDTKLSMTSLRPYLEGIHTRCTRSLEQNKFTPSCPLRIKKSALEIPELIDSTGEDSDFELRLSLIDLEMWVQDCLDQWLEGNKNREEACTLLANLMRDYTHKARSLYTGHPQEMSLMLLTLMNLWVAIDTCAIQQHSLLKSYVPGFSLDLLQSLILPEKILMDRLVTIEDYLHKRSSMAIHKSSLIFEKATEANSFGVRFYEKSQSHQDLRRKIEKQASATRKQKIQELTSSLARYNECKLEANLLKCEVLLRWNGEDYYESHSPNCRKCELQSTANSMKIAVHEWPLPYKELEAKATVFELDVPIEISEWRNATYTLLVDVLSPKLKIAAERDLYYLRKFDGLFRYQHIANVRVQMASKSKPFSVSHYAWMAVSTATEEKICVNNGLHYAFFDSGSNTETTNMLNKCDIQEICTFKLPPGNYHELQDTLCGTTHTSNEVLARQEKCPRTLNLHEFYAFATLRSGSCLQWYNIARQLMARDLNFSNHETFLMILQTAWQAGAADGSMSQRESHACLLQESFGMDLLFALENALEAMEGNWQNASALRTFTVLTVRLCSISPNASIHYRCYKLLKRMREVALQWTRDVNLLYLECDNAEEMDDLNLRALEMALTCHGTFVIDQRHKLEVFNNPTDLSTVIECCINIHDHSPSNTSCLPEYLKMLLMRFQRHSHFLETIKTRLLLEQSSGIDDAIRWIWKGYCPGTSWSSYASPNERWVVTNTAARDATTSKTVHYNVITGTLLINGCLLSRLPHTYEVTPTYLRLFGQKVLNVFPSTMKGMIYEVKESIHEHRVHFCMHGSTLIIRAQYLEDIYEVIPTSKLEGDFPAAFVNDYVHWMNITTGEVEWCPLNDAWSTSPHNWHLRRREHGAYFLQRGSELALDIRSPTAVCISRLMSPLDLAENNHISLDQEREDLKISLPRLKLDFIVKEPRGILKSKQFRGMVFDENQSFGAFTGLVNKIVLRDTNGSSRMVLVPHGTLTFQPDNGHVKVKIENKKEAQVKYHAYEIDQKLGRLIDTGSLHSRLFRLYLHATTSNCLVDELTGRTGTEEALHGLDSAATNSFTSLGSAEVILLQEIARLSPQHHFYPKHLCVMQQVKWSPLPPLSQHAAFYQRASSILNHDKNLDVFREHPTSHVFQKYCGNSFLLERAMIRSATFQVHGYGAEHFSTHQDGIYASRDAEQGNVRQQQTYTIARLANNWSPNIRSDLKLHSKIESWGSAIHGPSTVDGNLDLSFYPKWLEPLATFMPQYWCQLCEIFRQSDEAKGKYKLIVFLSTLSYSLNAEPDLVKTLLAFATNAEIRALPIPNEKIFNLADGYGPSKRQLSSIVTKHARSFRECPESTEPKLWGEDKAAANARRQRNYKDTKHVKISNFVAELIQQGPRITNNPCLYDYSSHISVEDAMRDARALFSSCQRNSEFRTYITKVEAILNMQVSKPVGSIPKVVWQTPQNSLKKTSLTFADLIKIPAPSLPARTGLEFDSWEEVDDPTITDHSELEALLKRFDMQCSHEHNRRYARDLWDSFRALGKMPILPKVFGRLTARLKDHLEQESIHVKRVFKLIYRQLHAGVPSIIQDCRLFPRISTSTLLSLLTSKKSHWLTVEWKLCLLEYGYSLWALQRAQRLLAASSNPQAFSSELQNIGHKNWSPADHPEWLLLEIENNISIRQEQTQIAQEMISPTSGGNSVMQLNMGLGKSSVITPIVAVDLADGSKLVRVVVLKALALQMFNTLVTKLGGMLNRRIWYMPISRSLRLDAAQAGQIRAMYEDCAQKGGILLIQPEHILSFELLGYERSLTGNSEVGEIIMQTENWLRDNSRDILDESDEILSVRFELIYTIGTQRDIDFSPHRWAIIQSVLQIVGQLAPNIVKLHPQGLEVLRGDPRSFPRVRILKSEAGEELLREVARHVCEKGIMGVPLWILQESERYSLFEYITDLDVKRVTCLSTKPDLCSISIRNGLLLLKGLFAGGVLKFALEQKRWRVNFGLDPSRTMLAVPFRAKDSPTARSEFSHPDVAILFTCISYYYKGLSDQQMLTSLEMLIQSDHASEEYSRWVLDAPALAESYRQISGINLKHTTQCSREIFPFLKFAPSTIDYYLKNVVFPASMKEFPHKLSTSGWDIAREKSHPTTGFSGTNDSRYILPLSISQCDLPQQLSTNAAVLECLLRRENDVINTGADELTLSAEALIKIAVDSNPQYRVILDVGAQVLELQNEEVAQTWLLRSSHEDVLAAIFFDRQNELSVLTRDGMKEPLQTSPFLKQMDKCLVYLDEAHTRGTDLQMPENYQAIVTLGPGLVKDRLVQACMRMRKLGKGQSVAFCGSREIQQKIRDCTQKMEGPIVVADVLLWCCAETCTQTRRSIPLWRNQGVRHQRRCAASSGLSSGLSHAEFVKSILEPEAQTLEQRYGHRDEQEIPPAHDEAFVGREMQLASIRARCQEFGVHASNEPALQEEQERELSHENERERQVERPQAYQPHKHSVHEDVWQLVINGVLKKSSDAFSPAFELFRNTSASLHMEPTVWPTDLIVTNDFNRTIQGPHGYYIDDFLRPVHWILSCKINKATVLVIISPYEAQELLPHVREQKKVSLHVYSPRVKISQKTLEDLSFCAVPAEREIHSARIRELNIFAGQIYLRSHEEYVSLCEFLGLCSKAPRDDIQVGSDGFVSPASRANWNTACKFTSSPVEFLRKLIAIRRKGHSFTASHLGKILNRELLTADVFVEE